MHLTHSELYVLPDLVAFVAIIGGYLAVVSLNRTNARLARETYGRERLNETYLDLLKSVHLRNAHLEDSYTRPLGKPPRTPAEIDPTTEDEAVFGARLMAYASADVDRMWTEFATLSSKVDDLLSVTRQATGLAPIDVQGPARQPVDDKLGEWRQKRDELQAQIRHELRRPATAAKVLPAGG